MISTGLKSLLLKNFSIYKKFIPNNLKLLFHKTHAIYKRFLFKHGIKVWPTKSYEVWMVIQFLLFKTKPKNLIEFGSGRSTHYFAEYAFKYNCNLFSIEQNKSFIRKNIVGLTSSYLPISGLYHVPLSGDWFETKKLENILDSTTLDFILVDAPGGVGNQGKRNSKVGNDFLKNICQSCAVIIFDDTHRKTDKAAFNQLKDSLHGDYFQVCMNYPVAKVMNEISFLISIAYYSSFCDFVSTLSLDNEIISVSEIP